MRWLLFPLILGLGLSAAADIPYPDDEPQNTSQGAGALVPAGTARTPARSECEEMLTGKSQLPPNGLQLAKIRAGELALMLIFEHPTFLQAAENPNVSSRDLYSLFHLSGGFAIKPKIQSNWAGRDLTYFDSVVRRTTRKENRIWWNRKNPEDSLVRLQRSLDFIANNFDHRSEGRSGEAEATILYDVLLNRLTEISENPGAEHGQLRTVNSAQGVLKNYKYRDPESEYSYNLKNFRAFKDSDLMYFERFTSQIENTKYAYPEPNLGELMKPIFVQLIQHNLNDILVIRNNIMQNAAKIGIREALLTADHSRMTLRHRILRSMGVRIEGDPEPKLEIPVLVARSLADLDGIQKDLDKKSGNTMAIARQLMEHLDALMNFGPLMEFDDPLFTYLNEKSLAKSESLISNKIAFMKNQALHDAQELDKLAVKVKPLIKQTQKRLEKLPEELEPQGLSELLAQAHIEEAELLLIGLTQSLSVIEQRHALQVRYLGILNTLQALLRKYRHQTLLGAKPTEETEAILKQFKKLVPENLPAPSAPTSSGLGRRRGGGTMIII